MNQDPLADNFFTPVENTKPFFKAAIEGFAGSGKTYTAAKLAIGLHQKIQSQKPVVFFDTERAAGFLKPLFAEAGIQLLVRESKSFADLQETMKRLRSGFADILIIDTAGRLQIDRELMGELAAIDKEAKPHETLLVVDALTGQEAVNVAQGFKERVSLTGLILTKLDGDARGGAAISVREVTGVPIKFAGVGEGIDGLEAFHPERMASRILGMGDVLTLIEKAEQTFDQEQAEKAAAKMQKGTFDLEDLRNQLLQMKKMGGMGSLMNMMPGMNQMKKAMAGANIDEKVFDRQIAVINSMTKAERANPDLLNAKRRIRIAAGSGTKVEDVNKLMKQHRQMADMMKKVSKGGLGSLAGMFGGKLGGMMPGLGNMPDPATMDPRELERMAREMGIDPASIPQAPAAAPKDISQKLPTDVGQLLKSGSGMPGLGGTSRFPGLPGLGGGFVPKKK